MYLQMDKIEKPPRRFHLIHYILSYLLLRIDKKMIAISGMTIVEKLINYCRDFEDALLFKRQPMESFEKRSNRHISVTVCHNSSKYILNTLEFVHFKARQIYSSQDNY